MSFLIASRVRGCENSITNPCNIKSTVTLLKIACLPQGQCLYIYISTPQGQYFHYVYTWVPHQGQISIQVRLLSWLVCIFSWYIYIYIHTHLFTQIQEILLPKQLSKVIQSFLQLLWRGRHARSQNQGSCGLGQCETFMRRAIWADSFEFLVFSFLVHLLRWWERGTDVLRKNCRIIRVNITCKELKWCIEELECTSVHRPQMVKYCKVWMKIRYTWQTELVYMYYDTMSMVLTYFTEYLQIKWFWISSSVSDFDCVRCVYICV